LVVFAIVLDARSVTVYDFFGFLWKSVNGDHFSLDNENTLVGFAISLMMAWF